MLYILSGDGGVNHGHSTITRMRCGEHTRHSSTLFRMSLSVLPNLLGVEIQPSDKWSSRQAVAAPSEITTRQPTPPLNHRTSYLMQGTARSSQKGKRLLVLCDKNVYSNRKLCSLPPPFYLHSHGGAQGVSWDRAADSTVFKGWQKQMFSKIALHISDFL